MTQKHKQYFYVSERTVAATNIVIERRGSPSISVLLPTPAIPDGADEEAILDQLVDGVKQTFSELQKMFGDLTGAYECYYIEVDEDDIFSPGEIDYSPPGGGHQA